MSLKSLALIENWPVPTAAAGVVRADGTTLGTHGPVAHRFPLASVTKPLAAYAALVAYEEGAIELDEAAGPAGSTVRHLLAHTSGLAFDEHRVTAPPGERRLYSNAGFEQLGDHIAKAADMPFAEYARQAVLEPLGMTSTALDGSPAKDGVSTVEDLLRFAAEVQAPRLLDPRTVAEAMTVQYPGTKGVLPGYGHQNPNDWGLGFEIRDGKSPLDGRLVLPTHLRPLRPVGHLPVDRPGRRPRLRRPGRPRLRPLGGRGVAALHGRGARRGLSHLPQEQLGRRHRHRVHPLGVRDPRRVPRPQLLPAQRHLAPHHVDVHVRPVRHRRPLPRPQAAYMEHGGGLGDRVRGGVGDAADDLVGGVAAGVAGASHIWTKVRGTAASLRSTWRTPPAELRRCTSPARTTVSWPAESRWVSSPSTTHVTISV